MNFLLVLTSQKDTGVGLFEEEEEKIRVGKWGRGAAGLSDPSPFIVAGEGRGDQEEERVALRRRANLEVEECVF